jgi:hypothetical protein
MTTFYHKPIIIEAERYNGTPEQIERISSIYPGQMFVSRTDHRVVVMEKGKIAYYPGEGSWIIFGADGLSLIGEEYLHSNYDELVMEVEMFPTLVEIEEQRMKNRT